MSKETIGTTNQFQYLEELIEALKKQRDRFERLIAILSSRQQFFDQWIKQYLQILDIRQDIGFKLINLPNKEKETLKKEIVFETISEFENYIDEYFSKLIVDGRELTISELNNALLQIDSLIVELMTYSNRMKKGQKSASTKAKDIIVKKIAPISCGIGMIALDIEPPNLLSILAGYALVFKGLE